MIIQCPKCHFRQPRDRYCASCGVDLSNVDFTPPVKKGMSAGVFALAFVVVLGLSGWIFSRWLSSNKSDSLYTSTTSGQSARVVVNGSMTKDFVQSKTAPAETNAVAGTVVEAAAVTDSATNPAQNSQPTNDPKAALKNPSFTAQAEALALNQGKLLDAKVAGKKTAGLQIIFAEASEAIFSAFTIMSGNNFSVATAWVGWLPNSIEKTNQWQRMNYLKTLDTAHVDLHNDLQPISLFKGAKDPRTNELMGLNIQILPSEFDADSLQATLQIQRTLGESAYEDSGKQEMRESVAMGTGGSTLVSGVLPHRKLSPSEEAILSSSVFRVMKSKSFVDKKSEFVILFNYQGLL